MRSEQHLRMDNATFLAWTPPHAGRYELVEQHVVALNGASRAHARIVSNLVRILGAQLDDTRWMVVASDFAVDVGPATIRYPDVVVDRVESSNNDPTASAPALIAEVVSRSSAMLDLGAKAAEHLRLPSLAAYIVLAQDEAKAWVCVRGPQGFPPAPIVAGRNAVISVAALGLNVALRDIYAGLALR